MQHVFPTSRRLAGVVTSLLLAFLLVLIMARTMTANSLVANLEGSAKSVSSEQAWPGQTLHYTVIISNSGDTVASNVAVTDTLPASLAYEAGTVTATVSGGSTTGFGESNGVITWTGSLDGQGYATLSFAASLTDTLLTGDMVTNTAVISGTGDFITRTASTTIITGTTIYLPILATSVPTPTLHPVTRLSSVNEWTVTWTSPAAEVTRYELQEAPDESFTTPTTYDVGLALSHFFNPPATIHLNHCYRVRAFVNDVASEWSNSECVFGNYRDDFNDPATNWAIRREDTDDTENSSYYENGNFVLKIGGRWDYSIGAPVRSAPWTSYQVKTRVILEGGIDNLHSYGLIVGGDWNGQPCPNGDYSSCFNHYYRLNVIWFGSPDRLRVNLKRIDYHDPDENTGQGITLIPYRDMNVGDSSGWNEWLIQVSSTGNIKVFVNNNLVGEGNDTKYNNDRYFGVFASSNEYLGTEPWFDWFEVSPLP
jgi:uncharacterized repeat protein (TIGR01451 family)